MKGLLAKLSGLSGSFRQKNVEDKAPAQVLAPASEASAHTLPEDAVFPFRDTPQPAVFLSVLSLLVPTQQMADTAFDDYHPTFFFGLQRWGALRASLQDIRPGMDFSFPARHNPAQDIIAAYRDLIEELDKYAPAWDQNGRQVRHFDAGNYMRTVYENLDLLSALKTALETPIEKLPFVQETAFARPDQPLKADIAFNTRFGKAYHTEYLEDFLRFIDWVQERALQLDLDVRPALFLNAPDGP